MPKVPYPYVVNGKLVTGNGSLIPICFLSNRSLLSSLTVPKKNMPCRVLIWHLFLGAMVKWKEFWDYDITWVDKRGILADPASLSSCPRNCWMAPKTNVLKKDTIFLNTDSNSPGNIFRGKSALIWNRFILDWHMGW